MIRYRQVDRASANNSNNEQEGEVGDEVTPTHSSQSSTTTTTTTVSSHHEPIDFNWRPVSVPPSAGNTFTVQNLSQDTSYEFYIRAKNIIGEGPRSEIILATTKRAVRAESFSPLLELDPSYYQGGSGKFAPSADKHNFSKERFAILSYYENTFSYCSQSSLRALYVFYFLTTTLLLKSASISANFLSIDRSINLSLSLARSLYL